MVNSKSSMALIFWHVTDIADIAIVYAIYQPTMCHIGYLVFINIFTQPSIVNDVINMFLWVL